MVNPSATSGRTEEIIRRASFVFSSESMRVIPSSEASLTHPERITITRMYNAVHREGDKSICISRALGRQFTKLTVTSWFACPARQNHRPFIHRPSLRIGQTFEKK